MEQNRFSERLRNRITEMSVSNIQREVIMKKGRLHRSLAALLMIFQLTSCGASKTAYDTAYNGKASEAYRVTADAVYETEFTSDAAFGFADSMSTYSYAEPESKSSASSTSPAANDLSERKIIRNASVHYQTKTYDEFRDSLTACIRRYGAYVESEESYGSGPYDTYSARSAYLTVRVPLTVYDSFMEEVCTLGSVTYRSETSSDVTMAYVDTESRIKALETEYDALIAILEKASKLEEVITLQSRISEVTYELETYKSQLRKYDDLISYCTVRIDVHEVEKVTPNVREMTFAEKLRDGLADTFEDIADDAETFALWFVTSFPYFVLWGLFLAAAILLLRRRIVRYRKCRNQNHLSRNPAETDQNENNQTNP